MLDAGRTKRNQSLSKNININRTSIFQENKWGNSCYKKAEQNTVDANKKYKRQVTRCSIRNKKKH